MAGSRFLRVFSALERRRGWAFAGLSAAVLLSGLVLTQVRFDNTLDLMLPADSPAQRMMTFLRESNFSNKIVISLEARGPEETRASLMAAADALAAALEPPLVTGVIKGFTTPDLMQDAGVFLGYTPQLLGSNDLAAIERCLTPDGVDALLKQHYLQLLKPEGMFMVKAIQSDPLNLNRLIMMRLQTLSASMDYDVTIENGHFLSRDGRHALLVAETSVPMTDAAGSRRLLDYLAARVGALPPGIRASTVCGHLHVVSNDAVIKRDLGVILGIASVGFMVLYLAFFRDPRGLLVFLMPALAAVIAMAVTSLWFPKLSYFVLAFGPVIAGIADDYGIAAYVAVRYGRHPGEAVRHIAKPVLVGAITTMAIFFAFFFSRIPGYRQLACFCIVSVFIAVGLALFILPLCIRPGAPTAEPAPVKVPTAGARRRRDLVVTGLFAAFLLVAGLCAGWVRFDGDVTRLDGTAPAILQAEVEFQKVWGVRDQRDAMLVVVSPDQETTLEMNDAVYRQAASLAGTNRFVTLASVWPSLRTRAENARQWSAFWQEGRGATLRRLLAERGAVYGFATNAFEPFFAGLSASNALPAEPAANLVFSSLKDRFVQTPKGRVQALSYFPDDPALVQAFATATQGRDDVFIVSRSVLGGILSDAFSGEVVRTSLLAGVLIVVTAFLFLRSVPLTLIALTPALAGVVGLLGGMAVLQRPLNVANLISGVVVFGLCIDFGVHVLHAWRRQESRTTRLAVTFAAATTLMGAGVLLFARHPALHSIGFTLFVGVGVGYVAAMWAVPALCGLLPEAAAGEAHE
jgi:predicted exporter